MKKKYYIQIFIKTEYYNIIKQHHVIEYNRIIFLLLFFILSLMTFHDNSHPHENR